MKSREILPEKHRDKVGNNYGRAYVNLIFKALEAAEKEITLLKDLSSNADERYKKALESLKDEDLFPNNCAIEKALKIAAYGNGD